MPIWAQIILGSAAVVTALGILWTKVIHPMVKFISTADEMMPLLRELTKVFRDTPDAFKVLSGIAKEFYPDSGTSLRDVINRLDDAARDNKTAAEHLKVGVETQRQLAEQDRKQLSRLLILLDRLSIKVEETGDIAKGIKRSNDAVATDLADSQRRADETEGDCGAAADAAARTPDEP